MTAFDFSMRTRIVFGPNVVAQVGNLARELGGRRAFLVTDPHIVEAGHADRAEEALKGSGVKVRRFDGVKQNPNSADVDSCRAALGDFDAQIIIGIGGGSSLDVAKGCNFVRTWGGRIEDYWGPSESAAGKQKNSAAMLPMIAIPTTAGTGSETQSYALIEQEGSHQKMACGHPQAAPRVALLDPTLTVTQPRFVTACTGLDALGHAVETAVTRKRNSLSCHFSTEAFKLIVDNLPRVLKDSEDLGARGHMLLAAAFAGIAIENSMLGAAHSMANPLTAHHGIVHGQAVAMMLPLVVRFNADDPEIASLYRGLARAALLCEEDASDAEAVDALIERLESLLQAAGFAGSLETCGVPHSAIHVLADEASRQWTAGFNPRKVTVKEFTSLFEKGLSSTSR